MKTKKLNKIREQRIWRACNANLRTRWISLAAILTQQRRHGLEEATSGTFRRCRRRRNHACSMIAQWQSGESSESREDPSFRLALEISATRHRTVVLPWSLRSNLQDLLARASLILPLDIFTVSFYRLNNYLYSRLTAILLLYLRWKGEKRLR